VRVSTPLVGATSRPFRYMLTCLGFGGTNAHAIVESYNPATPVTSCDQPVGLPIVLSTNSERTLKGAVEALIDHLKTASDVDLRSLAWTLLQKRSVLPFRRAYRAQTAQALCDALENDLVDIADKHTEIVRSEHKRGTPAFLGIFTGQGKTHRCLACSSWLTRCRGSMACDGQRSNRWPTSCF
jgi:acyl transferase domain-containing protein